MLFSIGQNCSVVQFITNKVEFDDVMLPFSKINSVRVAKAQVRFPTAVYHQLGNNVVISNNINNNIIIN